MMASLMSQTEVEQLRRVNSSKPDFSPSMHEVGGGSVSGRGDSYHELYTHPSRM